MREQTTTYLLFSVLHHLACSMLEMSLSLIRTFSTPRNQRYMFPAASDLLSNFTNTTCMTYGFQQCMGHLGFLLRKDWVIKRNQCIVADLLFKQTASFPATGVRGMC